MKLHHLLLLTTLASSYGYACGVHQDTGFNFVTEPGSLAVFSNVIEVRKLNTLGNVSKSENVHLNSLVNALSQPYANKLDFSLFEATKGHYSQVTVGQNVVVTEQETAITANDLLLITDLDVMDALATNVMTWQQAKQRGLVTINGKPQKVNQLDTWFSALFAEAI
jgi:hypothetical protein